MGDVELGETGATEPVDSSRADGDSESSTEDGESSPMRVETVYSESGAKERKR